MVHAKHGDSDRGDIVFKNKLNASNVWRGIVWSSKIIARGLKWAIKNGSKVAFWTDEWVKEQPFATVAL